MIGTLYVVVNGRMVKASCKYPGGAPMDIEQHDHKHGNLSATRYTRRALLEAEHLGTIPIRLARLVGRNCPNVA